MDYVATQKMYGAVIGFLTNAFDRSTFSSNDYLVIRYLELLRSFYGVRSLSANDIRREDIDNLVFTPEVLFKSAIISDDQYSIFNNGVLSGYFKEVDEGQ